MSTQGDPTDVMGRRVLAYIVDALLIGVVTVAVFAITKSHAYTGAPDNACRTLQDTGFNGTCVQIGSRVYTWEGAGLGLGYGLGAVAGFLDLVLLQGVVGASIGKLLLGLRVVNAEGEVCGVGRAFVRWLLLIVDGICLVLGLIVALVTHPHRRIGDMVAGTYVVAHASVGRPVQVQAPAYQYQYGQPAASAPGWAPPGQQQPAGWGAPPPPAGWGQPPQPQPPAWGTPPQPSAPPQQPGWGAPPPPPPAPEAAPPAWGAPPSAPPPPPQQQPGWGAAPPPPAPPAAPAPEAAPPGWGAPPPPPAPAPEPSAPPAWNAPPQPAPPAPAAPPTTPAPPAPPAPAAPDTPPPWSPPPPTEPPPPPPSAPAAPAAKPEAQSQSGDGESWWDRAFSEDEDDQSKE